MWYKNMHMDLALMIALEEYWHISITIRAIHLLWLILKQEFRKEGDTYIHFIYQILESEKDNGILPEEPKFYSVVMPSKSNGV